MNCDRCRAGGEPCPACERAAEDRADRRAGRLDGDHDTRDQDVNYPREWRDSLKGQ